MDFKLPELGEGVYEAELVAWHVKPGDMVKRGQNLMEVMTDKATMEVPSPFAGTVTRAEGRAGAKDQGRRRRADLRRADGASEAAPEAAARQTSRRRPAVPTAAVPTAGPPSHRWLRRVKASPSVRYMARKLGIDLAGIHGSGPAGRILLEDLTAADRRNAAQAARPAAATSRRRLWHARHAHQAAGLRRKIAEHMVLPRGPSRITPTSTSATSPSSSACASAQGDVRQPGVKLTYLAFFVKAVVAALKEVPIVNATLDEEASEIVLHDRYHIGIAVATPGGLIVPVVHDADKKDLVEVAREIERLSNEARAGKVEARRPARRHFHHHVDRQHRRPDLDAGHQPSRGRHPRHRQGDETARLSTRPAMCGPPTWSIFRSRSITASSMAPSAPLSATP